MRQVTSLHRTLVVLAVGLLALAAPLVAYADGGRPLATERMRSERRHERGPLAGLSLCRRPAVGESRERTLRLRRSLSLEQCDRIADRCLGLVVRLG